MITHPNLPYHGVWRPGDRLFGLLRFAEVDPEVLDNCAASVIGEGARVGVADPRVDPAPPRVYVVHVLKPKVVLQCRL